MKFIKLFSGFFSILILLSVILYLNKMSDVLGIYPYEAKINLSSISKNPEFIYLGGGSFKTVDSAPVFADDCLGCGELGDIHVYHNSESVEQAKYTFDANCNRKPGVVEKGIQFNDKGEKIGERCIVVFSEDHARIVWTESEKDVWIMSAPTLELVREFEKSEIYKMNKPTLR